MDYDARLVDILERRVPLQPADFHLLLDELQQLQDTTAEEYASTVEEDLNDVRKALKHTTERLNTTQWLLTQMRDAYSDVYRLALRVDRKVRRPKRWRKKNPGLDIAENTLYAVAAIACRIHEGKKPQTTALHSLEFLEMLSTLSVRQQRELLLDAAVDIVRQLEELESKR